MRKKFAKAAGINVAGRQNRLAQVLAVPAVVIARGCNTDLRMNWKKACHEEGQNFPTE
jgi:hypothetical protein